MHNPQVGEIWMCLPGVIVVITSLKPLEGRVIISPYKDKVTINIAVVGQVYPLTIHSEPLSWYKVTEEELVLIKAESL